MVDYKLKVADFLVCYDKKFDDLPNDIKIKILSINEENNFKEHQKKFNNVLYELQCVEEELEFYFDFENMDEEDLNNCGLSYFILSYLEQINLFSDTEDY
jgi:hypothetical protein